MTVTRRIFVSMPADPWLPDNLNRLKWGIVERIAGLGYLPEIFTNPRGGPGLAAPLAWTPGKADEVARRACGFALIGMARWRLQDAAGQAVKLPTEYNHYEGAIARTLGLPTLTLVQGDVGRRVVFDPGFGGYVGVFPPDADEGWLQGDGFGVPFAYWTDQLGQRRDVFLGYCGSSARTARAIKSCIAKLGATVLDWQVDLRPASSILQQIEAAAARTSGGIFLFTGDDALADASRPESVVPRDNVVLEAGYFIAAKGKRSVLIIREADSRMPADLGGDIYAELADRGDIAPARPVIARFLQDL
jgi:hypothetical protein